jgi:breast cancer metastasis-suppressor 1-like protein
MENETLLMMEERDRQDDELDKAPSNEDLNTEYQDQDQDQQFQQQNENMESRLDHDDGSSSSSSSSDSSDSSDSEDSSEMDEEATEKKKLECQSEMQALEKQFLFLRELFYRERITLVHRTIDEVRTGKAREYLGPLEELQDNMRVRIEIASVQRDFSTKSLNVKYDAEKLSLKQNLENQRQLIYDTIKNDLEDRIHRLELDRNNDFTSDYWFESSFKKKTKKSLDIFGEKKKKAITVNGPYIVYMLSDIDIVEDWQVLKKALNTPKRKFNGEGVMAY